MKRSDRLSTGNKYHSNEGVVKLLFVPIQVNIYINASAILPYAHCVRLSTNTVKQYKKDISKVLPYA